MSVSLVAVLKGAFRWWRDALAEIGKALPISGGSDQYRALVLAVEENGARILEERGKAGESQFSKVLHEGAFGNMLQQLQKYARRSSRRLIGVRIPLEQCFSRTLEFPVSVRRSLAQVVDLDLERATPFRLGDVYSDFVVERSTTRWPDKLRVQQFVAKRETIDPVLRTLSEAGVVPAFVDCWNSDKSSGLQVNFISPRTTSAAGGGSRGLCSVLAALVLLLAASAATITLVKHRQVLAEMEAQANQARLEASDSQAAIRRSGAVLSQVASLENLRQNRTPPLRLVDELTRLLPDTTWLSSLRIGEEDVDLTGYSESAASLIPLLEASSLLKDVSLVAPVTFDTREGKERFSMHAQLRSASAMPQGESIQKAGRAGQ